MILHDRSALLGAFGGFWAMGDRGLGGRFYMIVVGFYEFLGAFGLWVDEGPMDDFT